MSCSIDEINNFNQSTFNNTCQYVKIACISKYDLIDFFELFYCDFAKNVPAIIIFSIFFVVMCFLLCSILAESYVSSALEVIAKRLKLSAAVAGCTLLAIGNGAPDLMSAYVAGGKSSFGLVIVIGALFGGCLFNLTIVIAVCIWGGNEITLNRKDKIRDCIAIIIIILYFLILLKGRYKNTMDQY